MRDTPYTACPNAVDLRDYLLKSREQRASLPPRFQAIEKHLTHCVECAAATEFLRNRGIDWTIPTPETVGVQLNDDVLTKQREQIQFMCEYIGAPEPGQIWATRFVYPVSAESPEALVAASVIVLRVFVRELTGNVVADVAPVTDSARLAADWSIIFTGKDSGILTPVVAHLDAQFTTDKSQLTRCFGSLPAQSHRDLITALRAFDEGAGPPTDLEVAAMGRIENRRNSTWKELAERFDILMRSISVLNDDDPTEADTTEVGTRQFAPPAPDIWTKIAADRPSSDVWAIGYCTEQGTTTGPSSNEAGAIVRWLASELHLEIKHFANEEGLSISDDLISWLYFARTPLTGNNWRSLLNSEIGRTLSEDEMLFVTKLAHKAEDCVRKRQRISNRAARSTDFGN